MRLKPSTSPSVQPHRAGLLLHSARQLARAAIAVLALASLPSAQVDNHNRGPILPPGCEALQVPAGNQVSFRVYALGVQIYRWNGTAWVFVAPAAWLFAATGYGLVGIHYAGPTWESNSGAKVVGARLQGCSPDPTAIPWLLLGAASTAGPGIFADTTFIQRVNTIGGLAPGRTGAFVGEEASVPYSAEYYFYRAHG